MAVKILQGLFLGISLVLPGMSAATALIIMGFYQRFIEDLSNLKIKKYLPLASGTLIGILASVQVIDFLLEFYPDTLVSILMGMLLSSVVLVMQPLKDKKINIMLLPGLWSIAGFLIAWSIAVNPLTENSRFADTSPVALLAGGLLTSVTMLLPGVSGSSALIMIGLYDDLIRAVPDQNWLQIVFFSIGFGTGIPVFARIIVFIYRKYQVALIFLLTGLMAGSSRALLPQQFGLDNFLLMLTGAAVVLLINMRSETKSKRVRRKK